MDKKKNLTFYYSKFSLFNDSLKFCFTKYNLFKEKLKMNLGDDWKIYSEMILSNNQNFIKSNEILNVCLEIWLNMRKELKILDNGYAEDFTQRYEHFETEFSKFFSNCIRNDAYYKPVLQGFFTTANRAWTEVLQISQQTSKAQKKKMKCEAKQSEKMGYLRKKLNNFRQIGSTSLVIKPLIVASEKFYGYFDKKNDQKSELSIDEKKNFDCFRENLIREGSEELREKLNQLSLNEESTKFVPLGNKRKSFEDLETRIQIKKISKNEEDHLISSDFLGPTTKYIEKFMETSKEKWHVARCFVANMIEINYNRLYELENKVTLKAQDIKNNIKVRVLQPAENFYHHLMKIWIIFRSNSFEVELSFHEYLEKVKESMGPTWSEKYLVPTQVFFETLITEWNLLKEENITEEQNLVVLIQKVREDLMKLWEENIINKIQSI